MQCSSSFLSTEQTSASLTLLGEGWIELDQQENLEEFPNLSRDHWNLQMNI